MTTTGPPARSVRDWRYLYAIARRRKRYRHSRSTGHQDGGRAGQATAGACSGDGCSCRAVDHGGAHGVVRLQSSQWSGEMSIAFSEASGARIEAARQAGVANAARQADLSIWGVYL